MLIDIRTDDRNALAFLKWIDEVADGRTIPDGVLHFLYAVQDSVVR